MELFKLLGTIAIDNKDANKALDETSGKGKQAESKLGKAFSGIGKGALAVGKAALTGMVAAGTAVAGLVTQSTQSYAEYEQLVGGVETLFKDSASKVMEYANNAYRTAGMSANEYMTTVTSFSASLLQSLGGDTEAAAQKANLAITDMSDNANKMGTSMEAIQNAYQGFAKQNYTMLDNLKLGYGGTKAEMDRLITDAMKLDSTFQAKTKTVKKNGKAVQELDYTYADVVDAIHIVQTEMGITGTTAAEAAGTIAGSGASVKAAWENLVTAMADDNANLGSYVTTFVDSLSTAAENMIPRIGIALEGVVQLIDQLAPVVIEKIPGLIGQLLPAVITAATGLLNSVVAILPGLIDMLVNTVIPQLLTGLVSVIESIVAALPSLISTLLSALPSLLTQINAALTSLFVSLCTMLPQIIQPIIDNLPAIIESINNSLITNLPLLVEGLVALIVAVVQMWPTIITSLISAIPGIVGAVVSALIACAPSLLMGLVQLIWEVVKQLPLSLTMCYQMLVAALIGVLVGLWDGLVNLFAPLAPWFNDNVVQPVIGFFQGLWEGLKVVWDGICAVVSFAFELICSIIDAYIQLITLPFRFIWENCKQYVFDAFEWIKGIIDGAIKFIQPLVQAGFTFIKDNIVQPILDAKDKAVDAFNKIKEKVQEKISDVKDKVYKIFGDIKTKISDTVTSIKDKVTDIFNKVKEAMQKPIEDAKDKIGAIVDTIKGFFSGLKLEFPGIKLPHFSVTPSGWGIGDLLTGVVPKLSIKWYKDAMDNPMIMNKPTIFGYDASTGKLMGGGEAGSEVVSGTDTLMNMISSAVATQNEGIAYYLEKLIEMLAEYFPEALDAMRTPAVFNPDTAAAALAVPMNRELGYLAAKKGRGR